MHIKGTAPCNKVRLEASEAQGLRCWVCAWLDHSAQQLEFSGVGQLKLNYATLYYTA